MTSRAVTPVEHAGANLLYQAATGLEKAMADVDAERLLSTYAELIIDQWDPDEISETNLPYLAWAMSVNLWERDWPTEFKRYWTKNQWEFLSQRGTPKGLRTFVRAVTVSGKFTAELRRVIRPPARAYAMAACNDVAAALEALVPDAEYTGVLANSRYSYEHLITWTDTRDKPDWQDLVDYERAQYVARFAQLRGYPYVANAELPYIAYVNAPHRDTLDRTVPSGVSGAYAYSETEIVDPNYKLLGVVTESAVDIYVYWHWQASGASRTWTERTVVRPYSHNGAFLGPLRPLFPSSVSMASSGERYTYHYTLYDRGVETQLTTRHIENVVTGEDAGWGFTPGVSAYDDEVVLPLAEDIPYFLGEVKYAGGGSKYGAFAGKAPKLRTVTVSRSGPLDLTQAKAIYVTVKPRADLIKLIPDQIATHHTVRKAETYAAYKQYLTNVYLPRSNAWQFLYDRWYLFDADRVPDFRKPGMYMGHCRFGIYTYCAEALVRVRVKLPKFYAVSTSSRYVRGFLRAPYDEYDDPITKLRRGVCASMALRDTILIDTRSTRKLQVGDLTDATGRYAVGQWVDA